MRRVSHIGPDQDLSSQAIEWLVLLHSGKMTEAELAAFRMWKAQSAANRDALQKAQLLWQASRVAGEHVPAPALTANRLHRRAFLWGTGASAAAAVAGLGIGLNQMGQGDYVTAPGQSMQLELGQEGAFVLNTKSRLDRLPDLGFTLRYGEAALTAGERSVLLTDGSYRVEVASGSALFRKWDGPLEVANLSARRVRIFDPDGSASDLPPRHAWRFETSFKPYAIDPEQRTAWQRGEIRFEGSRMDAAIEEVARYLPHSVWLMNRAVKASKISGVFATDQALVALRALARTHDLRLDEVGEMLIVIS